MIESDTIKLLRECDAGIKMGIVSIAEILDDVKDGQLEKMLVMCKEGHEKLQKEIQRLSQEKLDLEKAKLEKNSEIEWYKARNQKEYNDRLVDLK